MAPSDTDDTTRESERESDDTTTDTAREWTGHYQFQAFCSCGDSEIEIPLEDALDWTREHMSMHEDRDPDNRHVEISISKRF